MSERDIAFAKPWKWIGTDGWTFNREADLLKFADLIRADEREFILNLVQKIAVRFYKDDAEEAFEELTEAIRETHERTN